MSEIWDRIADKFSPQAIGSSIADWIPSILAATVTLLAFWLLYRVLRFVVGRVMRRADTDETTAVFVQTTLRAVILAIGFASALSDLGVNMAALLASLGIVGLTIGFAARDALSNLISGLLIFWDRPFVIGDLVEIDGTYGKVERITLRSTRVVTPDGKMLAIPNTTVIGTTCASYTNFPHLRLDVDVCVGVNEDIDRVRELLLGLVADRPGFQTSPAPVVVVTNLGDFNVTLELRAWISEERAHIAQRTALREAVFKRLTEAGVDMPYETFNIATAKLGGDEAHPLRVVQG